MRVVSLFDGISCGKLALERSGIPIEAYRAFEIDKHAIKISTHNHPEVIQLGDATTIRPKVFAEHDLLLGGSPCQSFSKAGPRTGFEGKSNLFWTFNEFLQSGKFRYFLLENVVMPQEWQDIISKAVGVEPIKLNSANFSAQKRVRLYWTNIPLPLTGVPDNPSLLCDVLESDIPEKYYLKPHTIERINNSRTAGSRITENTNKKSNTVIAGYGRIPSDCEYIRDARGVRKLTPVEFERLQTLPDNYSACVANTHRYRAVGNGWNINTIQYLLQNLR